MSSPSTPPAIQLATHVPQRSSTEICKCSPRSLQRSKLTLAFALILARDGILPSNAGRWRLTTTGDGSGSGSGLAASCVPATSAADLALDVTELGAAYLGGTRLGALAGAGQSPSCGPAPSGSSRPPCPATPLPGARRSSRPTCRTPPSGIVPQTTQRTATVPGPARVVEPERPRLPVTSGKHLGFFAASPHRKILSDEETPTEG